MLISFILLGWYLEVLAKGKTSQAIAKLIDLTPDTKILITQDCLVVWRQSHVNESMINGEAKLLAKIKGDMMMG